MNNQTQNTNATSSADPVDFPKDLKLQSPNAHYILDNATRLALRMAWVTQRPLLVVGEPGCGKTALADAVAQQWEVPLLPYVVHSRTEASDLLYQHDAVARLADAQIYKDLKKISKTDPLNNNNYLTPGPLWWLINPESANSLNKNRPYSRKFEDKYNRQYTKGGVVLIDEIDKGSQEVAEGLLEVLDSFSFTVPLIGKKIKPNSTDQINKLETRRLVLITSNRSSALPAPFLRRCIVLNLKLPEHDALKIWLLERGKAHQGTNTSCAEEAMQRAADLIVKHRTSNNNYQAGLAEFLYLIDAAYQLAPNKQEEQIKLIEAFAPSVTTNKSEAASPI